MSDLSSGPAIGPRASRDHGRARRELSPRRGTWRDPAQRQLLHVEPNAQKRTFKV